MTDYTDYENNLAFAPTSADDLNEQGRKSDVLIEALNKCKKLEIQLKIAVECLKEYANKDNWNNVYDLDSPSMTPIYWNIRWKEENGYKLASKTLKELENENNN